MPESTGGGLSTDASLAVLGGLRWLAVDVAGAAAESALNGVQTAAALVTLANEPFEAAKRREAANQKQIKLTLVTAAALVAASIVISYK